MLNQYAVDCSHVPSRQASLFSFYRDRAGLPSRNNPPPDFVSELSRKVEKRFVTSTSVFFITSSWKIQSVDFQRARTADADFGQTEFGHPYLIDFGQP